MGTALVKQVLIELIRSGCRVETLLYDPPAVTFRTPTGARCELTTEQDFFQLAQQTEEDATDEKIVRFPTLREALRAAIAA